MPGLLITMSAEESRLCCCTATARTARTGTPRYRVIAVDSRGYGASGSGGHGLSFEMMAEDLKTVLDTLGVKKAHFLGFSDGGNLAIKFALTHPEYIDKLILNAANVEMFSGVKPQVQLPVMAGYGVAAALSRFSKKAARRRDVLGLMVHPYGVTMNDLDPHHRRRARCNTRKADKGDGLAHSPL